jgi:hypothetical protein
MERPKPPFAPPAWRRSDSRRLILGHAGEFSEKSARLLAWPVEIMSVPPPVVGHDVDEQCADFRGPAGLRSGGDRHHAGPQAISRLIDFRALLDSRAAPALAAVVPGRSRVAVGAGLLWAIRGFRSWYGGAARACSCIPEPEY